MVATLAGTQDLQTPWISYPDLDDYGWQTSNKFCDDDIVEKIHLEDAFDDLGISNEPIDWIKLTQWHDQESRMDGITYPATGGQYKNIVNFKDGAIVAQDNLSPRNEVCEPKATLHGVVSNRRELESTRIVPLNRWSDVVWLGMEQLIDGLRDNPDFKNKPIEHIFQFHLSNLGTEKQILNIAGKASIEDLGEWPGATYQIKDPRALASLSTPNGIGVVWMLFQHKEQMGVRKVDRVSLFNCEEQHYDSSDSEELDSTAARLCMYFHISSV